jgi:hypothetical protein
MVSQKEWTEKIKQLWGTSIVLLDNSSLSVDEHISRARKLQDGIDPYEAKRKTKAQEIAAIYSQPGRKNWFNKGDEAYLELLTTGLINYPPQDRLDLIELKKSDDFLRQYTSEL